MTEEGIVHGNKIAMDGPGDQLQQGGPSAPAPAQKQSGGPVIYCMTALYRLSSKYTCRTLKKFPVAHKYNVNSSLATYMYIEVTLNPNFQVPLHCLNLASAND